MRRPFVFLPKWMVVAMSSTTVVPLLISFLFISTLPPCRPLSFSYNFSDPRTFDGSNIITAGTATLAQKDASLIELTQNPDPTVEGVSNAMGRATYSKPVLLWEKATIEVTSFTTRFSFAIKQLPGHSGVTYKPSDGIAFFLSSYPQELPPYHGGKYLGLVDGSTNATPAVVAVEFDTFQNDWDPYTDHTGIDVNSINSTAVEVLPMGTLTDRSEPMIVLVSYNSSMKLLAVALQLERTDGGMRYELNSTVDLKSVLPPEVAIGFSAASGYSTELHRVLAWSFNSTSMEMNLVPAGTRPMPNKVPHFPSKRMIWLVARAAGAAMLISVAFVGVLIRWLLTMRRHRWMNEEQAIADLEVCSMDGEFKFENGAGPRRFRYGELAAATNNFFEDGKLGEGVFGSVYSGSLSDLDIDVGRSPSRGYPRAPGRGGRSVSLRYEIALGVGSALLYLHVECKKCVVHRDVQPSNVMPDASLGAKLGNFGHAKLLDHGISLPTVVLAGTMGYMDPEYTASGRASTASDVHSFGIVLLEMCCGRRPRDDSVKPSLLEWVWNLYLYGRGAALEAADKRLDGDLDQAQMQRMLVVGLWCAHPHRGVRPSIKQALGVLQFEAPLPDVPPKMPVPTFSTSVAGPDADADGFLGGAGVYSSSSTGR
ncbi:hypothetical protein CFC21_055561 [Triticum aestivum]|uniref:non-specific serine/threonine protein kinase n=2 Tax=Triticum aestivum TaxID=4565 RepID=A0A3B6I6Y3_WHEAT|nr:hypothetical protein CFC21_055561 [Triticum aestivum]